MKVVYFIIRRSYDKQFKMAAVKLELEDNMSVAEVSKSYLSTIIVCIDGTANMKSMEKVRSQDMGPHFIHINMKSKS